MKQHAIMFHHFHDNNRYNKTQGSIDAKELERLLEYYQRKGFKILQAKEWYEKLIANNLQSKEVALTFDDGLRCQFEVASKILKKNKLTAFYFIPTQRFSGQVENLELFRDFRFSKFTRIEEFYKTFFQIILDSELEKKYFIRKTFRTVDFNRYLSGFPFYTYEDRMFRYIRNEVITEEEYNIIMYKMMKSYEYNVMEKMKDLYLMEDDLKKLNEEGNIIGLHSHTHHTALASTSLKKQTEEYAINKEILEGILNTKITTVSYPCNSYNRQTLDLMRKLGIEIGFRANMQIGFGSRLDYCREDHSNIIRSMEDENYGIYE